MVMVTFVIMNPHHRAAPFDIGIQLNTSQSFPLSFQFAFALSLFFHSLPRADGKMALCTFASLGYFLLEIEHDKFLPFVSSGFNGAALICAQNVIDDHKRTFYAPGVYYF
jgi:hypothetical protein